MLTELPLQNVKAFATLQRLRMAPITLIYGPNARGKSSLDWSRAAAPVTAHSDAWLR